MLLLRSVFGFVAMAFAFSGVERLAIGDATVLVMLSPLVAAIGGVFILKEPWKLSEAAGLLLSLAGAIFIVRPPFLFGNDQTGAAKHPNFIGVTFALLAALFAGFAFIMVRILGTSSKMPWPNVCFAQSLAQICFSIPFGFFVSEFFCLNLSSLQWALLFAGAFVGAWSQTLMTIGMQREKSARATAMRMSDVLFGFIWQAIFTTEKINKFSVFGASLIIASVLIIASFKQKSNNSESLTTQRKDESLTAPSALEIITIRGCETDVKVIPETTAESVCALNEQSNRPARRRSSVRPKALINVEEIPGFYVSKLQQIFLPEKYAASSYFNLDGTSAEFEGDSNLDTNV